MFFKTAVETIPFKTFLASKPTAMTVGSSYYSASSLIGGDIVNLVDFGFIFFIGLGITLISLSLLEKYKIEINTSIVKGALVVIFIAGIAYSVVTDGFIPHLIMGW